MIGRSWLFVPGDSERKQVKALASSADVLILDLEDSVAPQRRDLARVQVAAVLRSRGQRAASQQLWVRINSLASGALLEDLIAVMPGAPDGVVLPKAVGTDEVVELHHYLTALEQREALPPQGTRVVVIATESARAVLRLEGFAAGACPQRLAGLTWGAEDLSADLGAREKLAPDGALTPTFRLARSLCLLAAAAAGVQPIDGVYTDYTDGAGLARELEHARRDGFTGKLAVHPDQVGPINAAFTPTEAELAVARRIVAAFQAAPDVGVTSIDGSMVDRPHLLRAQRLLAAAEAFTRQ
ncbi:MAG TPA: CoA ester lyase [Steroidobacteraceae bacterium]|nr:CoA ester lyase [Steroidobacteraceae bacterium]